MSKEKWDCIHKKSWWFTPLFFHLSIKVFQKYLNSVLIPLNNRSKYDVDMAAGPTRERERWILRVFFFFLNGGYIVPAGETCHHKWTTNFEDLSRSRNWRTSCVCASVLPLKSTWLLLTWLRQSYHRAPRRHFSPGSKRFRTAVKSGIILQQTFSAFS